MRRVTLLAVLLLTAGGCKLPTEYTATVESPDCPWPPPMVTDSVGMLPLGCPWRLPSGEVVPGWPRF